MSENTYQKAQAIVSAMDAYTQLQTQILRASVTNREPIMEPSDLMQEIDEYPRFKTGIDEIDAVNGGIQGLCLLGGQKACGKSILAMQIGLYQAECGTLVIYYIAENGDGLQRKRIRRWYGQHEFAQRFARISGVNFFSVRVRRGHSFLHIAEMAAKLANERHQEVMLIFDSIDRIVRNIRKPGQNPFERKDDMLGWLDELSIETDGRVCSLGISELNKDAEMKGRTGSYTATVELKLLKEAGDDEVRIVLEKDRDGKSEQDLGIFIRDWGRTTFRKWDPDAAARVAALRNPDRYTPDAYR